MIGCRPAGRTDDFGLLGGDRQDDDLLLVVEGRAGPRRGARRMAGGAPRRSAGGGGSSVPSTCMPWSSSLTLVLLRPATTVTESSAGSTVMTGNLSLGEADDHVDVVAGLDDRADAADLVDLDARSQRRPAGISTSMTVPWSPPLRVVAVIWAPVATGWRAIWPMTWETSVKAPGRIARRGRPSWSSTWSAWIRVDSGMSAVATTTGPWSARRLLAGCRRCLRRARGSPTKATIARKTPMSRTSRFERFKLVLPEEMV